jgi:peptide/nickel transport system permease protein
MKMATRGLIALKRALHYKSFILGLVILSLFAYLIVYAYQTWPYDEAIAKWNNLEAWRDYPLLAKPAWITWFTGKKELEGSIILSSLIDPSLCTNETTGNKSVITCLNLTIARTPVNITITKEVRGRVLIQNFTFTLNYYYDEFPSEAGYTLMIDAKERVYIDMVFIKPNGLRVKIHEGYSDRGIKTELIKLKPGVLLPVQRSYREVINRTYGVEVDVTGIDPVKLLFTDDELFIKEGVLKVLNGIYTINIISRTIDINANVDAKFVIYGTVYGIAGTDGSRRDLFMAIAWGTPIAIAFGLTLAVLSTILVMIIAAIAAWYGRLVDSIISRVNEIFMILPFLPTIVMLFLLYGIDLWRMIWVILVFSVLGSGGIKSQRAMFLQIKEMPYIEAAKAYGASSPRIVFKYMVPRVIPLLIPSMVTAIPSFVFLEAALAILGIADPRLITWGKVLEDAFNRAALLIGAYHWILAPSIALFLLAVSFASIGLTLDRVFNPRLREL